MAKVTELSDSFQLDPKWFWMEVRRVEKLVERFIRQVESLESQAAADSDSGNRE